MPTDDRRLRSSLLLQQHPKDLLFRELWGDARTVELAPVIAEIQAAGITSARGIATALNERGIETARGASEWKATQVQRVVARL